MRHDYKTEQSSFAANQTPIITMHGSKTTLPNSGTKDCSRPSLKQNLSDTNELIDVTSFNYLSSRQQPTS